MPGRIRCWPWMTTFSPALRPSLMAISPSRTMPVLTRRCSTTFLSPSTNRAEPLVDRNRGLRHGDHGGRRGRFDHHAQRLAVGERIVLVVEHRPHDLAVGLGIDRDVDEIDLALFLVEAAVGQPELGDDGV